MHFLFDPDAAIESELDRLLAWSETIGVRLLIEFDREIFISDLGRDLDTPSTKGNGRIVLNALIGLADHHQVVVETSYMTDEVKLGAYYRSFGFRDDYYRTTDPDKCEDPDPVTNLQRPLPSPTQ